MGKTLIILMVSFRRACIKDERSVSVYERPSYTQVGRPTSPLKYDRYLRSRLDHTPAPTFSLLQASVLGILAIQKTQFRGDLGNVLAASHTP